MDPSRRGSYRAASSRDDGEVRITVDIFDQTPPNYNNTVYRSDAAPATRRPEIDLNNPAQQEEESPVHTPVVDAVPVQQAPVHEYTGSNYGRGNCGCCNYRSNTYGSGNYGSSSGDGDGGGGGYVDWARGSIDVAPDGKLAFYETAHPPTPVRDTGFDLNAAVLEAQEMDEAYCQERLENLRKGRATEELFPKTSFRNSSHAEDPAYYKLWNE